MSSLDIKKLLKDINRPKKDFDYFRANVIDDNAIGYCHNKSHVGKISKKIMKQHQCLAKNCALLEKYEHKRYWCDREVKKYLKKIKDKKKYYIIINDKVFLCNDNADKLVSVYQNLFNETGIKPTIKLVKISEYQAGDNNGMVHK